ncbi:Uncharacterised protein [Vibrio cholerae]|nr:Uncharacterised protein [Vibrio cholerae]
MSQIPKRLEWAQRWPEKFQPTRGGLKVLSITRRFRHDATEHQFVVRGHGSA